MSLGEQLGFPLGQPEINMASPYDSDALLALIRQMARAPSSTTTGWADADILRLVNAEMLTGIGAKLLKTRRDFFVTSKDYTLTAGTAAYVLPPRAAFGKVREVQLIGSDGTHRNLPERTVEALKGHDTTSNNGTPRWYYWRGNSLVLVPAPDASQFPTLRVWYFRRPSRLVATGSALLVDDASAAPTYTGDGTLTTSNGEVDVDIISGDVPHNPTADDVTPNAMGEGTVTFDAARDDLAVGDYVAEAGQSPVVQLPPEFFTVLARRVANTLLRGGADPQALAEGEADLRRLEDEAFGMLEPDRNEGEVEAIVNGSWG